jgi:ATPase subunit of ABC transporter with duplicated ATPase domains
MKARICLPGTIFKRLGDSVTSSTRIGFSVHTTGRSHILHGVTLHVQPGEVVGLLGRNGVGKSTNLWLAILFGLGGAAGAALFGRVFLPEHSGRLADHPDGGSASAWSWRC